MPFVNHSLYSVVYEFEQYSCLSIALLSSVIIIFYDLSLLFFYYYFFHRDSELLQGVFDKNMFGASSYGLVHLCFELLGPRAAGILLSIFARTFTTFLQIRGFSCCTGDFLMTPEGERNRERMIMHCTIAGNYLQEIFVDSINKTMKWKDTLVNANSSTQKYQAVHSALDESERSKGHAFRGPLDRLHQTAELNRVIDTDCFPTRKATASTSASSDSPKDSPASQPDIPSAMTMLESEIPSVFGINYTIAADNADHHIGLNDMQIKDVRAWRTRNFESESKSATDADGDTEMLLKPQIKKSVAAISEDRSQTFDPLKVEDSNPWDIARQLHSTMPADWRFKQPSHIINQTKRLIETLQTMGSQNKRLQHEVLETLTKTPELALYFPRVSQALGIDKLWGPGLNERLTRSTFQTPPLAPPGRIGPPKPNSRITLPSGRTIQGDGSLRTPTLYHPSWVYKDESGLSFDDPTRYATRMAEVKNVKDLEQYWSGLGAKPFHLRPNELTRLRYENLCRNHFAGREDALIRMNDGFFQTGMGKLTSKNNDLVAGNVTLYKFPFNGFASMITTGAKGSKVNFAMICGMLSQQSLEGKRVPVMVSGKTLPSFARYDLGSRAGGLITDRYLTGLRPQEFFFHCMAGREGLVDTAVKTARSGYLQRCVMKGMEGVMVQYDGTVRDSDGTIVQFLYGEDGVDVAKASYSKKLEDLLQNPTIACAKYWSKEKSTHPAIAQSMREIRAFTEEQNKLNAEIKSNPNRDFEYHTCINPLDPMSNVFLPTGYVGSVSEKYKASVDKIVSEDTHEFVKKSVAQLRRLKGIKTSKPVTQEEEQEARARLESLLFAKFSETLAAAGEGVGCLSAQSMGEPATQMTLNTFHLVCI